MPKYGYLVVEGPHDVEFVYRLLSPFGMSRVRLEKDLDPFFSPLIPRLSARWRFAEADADPAVPAERHPCRRCPKCRR